MSIEVNILDNGEGIEILASGIVYGRDIIQSHQKIYHEKHLKKQKYHIIDKSKCTEYDVTAKDIEMIAELDKKASKINPNIIIAVIESESLQFSLTGVWQAYVKNYIFKTETFQSREQAIDWITKNKP
ncbi:MAG: hypothetical protein OQK46_04325 [Gammaproteobacteria bacterium]|nr:hypothetical protein [Gammaproteobacteria bacterium]